MARSLGEILKEMGLIDESQLAAAVRKQRGTGRFLGEILVEERLVSEEDLACALARQLEIPYLTLGEEFRLDADEIHLVPEAVARRFCLIPTREDHQPVVTLVMADPLDLVAVDTVRSLTNLEVHKAVATRGAILAAIDRFYRADAHIEQDLHQLVEDQAGESVSGSAADRMAAEGADDDQLRAQANDAPVVRFVNLLLMQAVRDRASDIHFEPGEKATTIRFRVDGSLREVTPPPRGLYPAIVTRVKILSRMDIAEKRLPLDGRFKFNVEGRIVDVRVSSLPEVHGEKLVLRLLDRGSLLVDLAGIGFEEGLRARFQRVLDAPHGIILLTGPTGSGKTTTLYSALTYLKSPEKNIQTVEDPVEYLIPGVNQMQILPRIGLDFAAALRAILRQDPDIIMIGEIRDLETAQIAIRASLTGHLVLSTLHTNDSPSAFARLKDIGVEPYLTAATVLLVISQRLVRLICPHCAVDQEPAPELVRLARSSDPSPGEWHFRAGRGCAECGHTGFRGRTAILEFLEVTDPLREMIQGGASEASLRRRALELGMETLWVNGLGKARRGISTLGEVLSVCPRLEETVT